MHDKLTAPVPEHETDGALVERAARGDHPAFAQILDRYDSRLRREARRILGDDDAVDDVLQEAYVRAFLGLWKFRGESSLGTWLHRIIHNACLDELRRRRRRFPLMSFEVERPSTTPGPAEVAIERSSLESAVAGLPEAQRLAVLLVDAYGLDYGEAAAALGTRSGTVASRLHRGRAALQHSLRRAA